VHGWLRWGPDGASRQQLRCHGRARAGANYHSCSLTFTEALVTHRFNAVAVVGAGAIGSFYGAMLARAGHRVTLIGRAAHVQAIDGHGLRLQMAGRVETVRVAATEDLAAAHDADLVLFSVKSTDTETVARQMAPLRGRPAVAASVGRRSMARRGCGLGPGTGCEHGGKEEPWQDS
jgi:hypothetical protein